ncbi:flavin reductase [Streptosporangium sp. CA-115845]|uniref:flavin reductase n=1 Tax=Streptosporangium sp. CA-115845 TaxID=3240071 RepID=UPI003D922116
MSNSLAIDPRRFRQVLGNYPTGVTVITAIDSDGRPVGMAVGTFTSVSLDPPLVAFLPDKSSSSFPRIRTASSFCVNVLAADQEEVCRAFATRGDDKFAGVAWSPAPSGAPLLRGVTAWIDCDFESITDAGDHHLVMGRVRDLDATDAGLPLVFFQGGYGRFSPSSLVTVPEPDLIEHLRNADLARGEMERVAAEVHAECVAVAAVADELVVVAGAGAPARDLPRTRVGQRSPFLPPLGTLFLAGSDETESPETQVWLARAGAEVSDEQRTAYRAMVERVRERGWSLSIAADDHAELEHALDRYSTADHSPEHLTRIRRLAASAANRFEPSDLPPGADHPVRLISAPVIGADGGVILLLTLWGLPSPLSTEQIESYTTRLRAAARAVSTVIETRKAT